MIIDGFNEVINMLYIAKLLYDSNMFGVVKSSFFDELDCDFYYENMLSAIELLFEHYQCRYYESKEFELRVFSNKDMVDFFILAGIYGKQNNIAESENPYIEAAQNVCIEYFSFSYCLDFMLQGHTEPKRPFHSRLALLISYDGDADVGGVVYGLLQVSRWFSDKCIELRGLIDKEAIAA